MSILSCMWEPAEEIILGTVRMSESADSVCEFKGRPCDNGGISLQSFGHDTSSLSLSHPLARNLSQNVGAVEVRVWG